MAERVLAGAKTVCFVGYSLPDYNHDACDLFESGISSSTNVQVISPVFTDQLMERYKKAFPKSDVEFMQVTFAEYLWQRTRYPES